MRASLSKNIIAAMMSVSVLATPYLTYAEPVTDIVIDEQNTIDITGDTSDTIDFNETSPFLKAGITVADTEEGIERKRSGWKTTSKGKRYYRLDGSYAKGMVEIGNSWYLFDDNGYAMSGWSDLNGNSVYVLNDGLLADGPVEIGEDLFMFDGQGRTMSGWNQYNGKLYFSNGNGKIKTDLFLDGKRRYIATPDGVVNTGWVIIGDKTYFQKDTGLATGIQYIDGEEKLFGDDGVLANGFVQLNGHIYLADASGSPLSGFQQVEDHTYFSNAYGRIMKGWQTIDGSLFYFDHVTGIMVSGTTTINGTVATFKDTGELVAPMLNPYRNINDLSLSYQSVLYEGDYILPENFSENGIDVSLTQNTPASTVLTEDEGDWDVRVGTSSSVSLQTSNGLAKVDLTAIPVKDVVAKYDAPLYAGSRPLSQNISVIVVYEDGTERPINDFECELPEMITQDTDVKIISDYGNAILHLKIASNSKIYTSYEGAVREGESPDTSNVRIWTVTEDGRNQYLSDFKIKDEPIYKDTKIKVKVNGQTGKVLIPCIPVEIIKVSGQTFTGDDLSGRTLIMRFTDGSSRVLTPDRYTWIGDSVVKKGEPEKKISVNGHEYLLTINQEKASLLSSNEIIVSSGSKENMSYNTRQSLGVWTLTAYSDTIADQGVYVGQTASGAPLTEGRTVAVSEATMSRYGLNFGDKLEINGHVYTIEDHGGSPMHNKDWVDIFVADPARAYNAEYNTPSEVYLLR